MFKDIIRSEVLRRRTSWVVAAVLIFPLIMFFHATGQAPAKGPGGAAGIVFGKPIPWDVFQEQQLWMRRQLEQQMGGQIPEELISTWLNQSVWDRFILLEEARRMKIRVSNQEIADAIRNISALQENGRFISERYYNFLRAGGMSPQIFEDRLRNDLLVQKLVDAVKASVAVSPEEVKAAYTASQEMVRVTLVLVEPAAFRNDAESTATDEAIRLRYEAHPDESRIPEQLMIEYAGTSRDELTPHLPAPTDEQLKIFYDDHPDRFAKDDGSPKPFDEVRDAVKQAWTEEQLRKQLSNLSLDLQDGLDEKLRLEEIAAIRGLTIRPAGPLSTGNVLAPGGPEPAVLQAVAGLEDGRPSSVVNTGNGVYIARVTQRIPARIPPLDEVRGGVRQRIVQDRSRELAKTAADAFYAKLKEGRASGLRLEEVALMQEQRLLTSPPFTRTDPIGDLGQFPSVNDAAFNTPLREPTQVLETPRGFIVLIPQERIPADESKFAEQEQRLREEALKRRRSTHLEEWLNELRTRAKLKSFVDTLPAL